MAFSNVIAIATIIMTTATLHANGVTNNGVAAVPIMVLLMIMAARRAVMSEFAIHAGLKALGWVATIAMIAAVIEIAATASV